MAHEDIARANARKKIAVSLTGYYVLADTDLTPSVALQLDVADGQLGASLNISLVALLSPHEAREIAEALQRKADEAEAGLPRA